MRAAHLRSPKKSNDEQAGDGSDNLGAVASISVDFASRDSARIRRPGRLRRDFALERSARRFLRANERIAAESADAISTQLAEKGP